MLVLLANLVSIGTVPYLILFREDILNLWFKELSDLLFKVGRLFMTMSYFCYHCWEFLFVILIQFFNKQKGLVTMFITEINWRLVEKLCYINMIRLWGLEFPHITYHPLICYYVSFHCFWSQILDNTIAATSMSSDLVRVFGIFILVIHLLLIVMV